MSAAPSKAVYLSNTQAVVGDEADAVETIARILPFLRGDDSWFRDSSPRLLQGDIDFHPPRADPAANAPFEY